MTSRRISSFAIGGGETAQGPENVRPYVVAREEALQFGFENGANHLWGLAIDDQLESLRRKRFFPFRTSPSRARIDSLRAL